MPEDWSRWREAVDLSDYDRRWARMAAAGHNPHGEADFVCRYSPSRVLDAGCGTGRVGIELARRGIAVAGVDADPDMIAAARAKAPELSWRCVDLTEFSTDDRFDLVVLAGNVIPYVAAGSRADAVTACARALVPGGRLVAGFSLRPGWPSVQDYDGWCTDAGLAVEDRFATWDGEPYAGGDYLLAVHRSPEPG
ncbi:MAG TPA: class I SAM-dependent methyltransferase [Pseudonocardia sp.]|nr:class I SAM-dependent methyltransferase [Pseudonocardia sp.]